MRVPDAVLFDYGGTLVFEEPEEVVLQRILVSMGFDFSLEKVKKANVKFREHWIKKYSGGPRGQRWSEAIRADCEKVVLSELGVKGDLDDLATTVARRWFAHSGMKLFEDVKPSLNALRKMNIPMGVVSQNLNSSSNLSLRMSALGINGYFRVTLTSEDAGYDKPDAKLFLSACNLMNTEPRACYYVGNDYEKDVLGSLSAGMTPILIDRAESGGQFNCITINDLTQLPAVLSNPD
jgi:HAD superfamily hydrolase (TIGR01549 family)